jgi:alkaline phosphatase D
MFATNRRAAFALVLALFCSAGKAQTGLTHGPMLGAITPTTATVWARWAAAADVRLTYAPAFESSTLESQPMATSADADLTSKISLTDLQPDTVYRYSLIARDAGGVETQSAEQYFRTPPAEPAALSFVVLSDFMTGLKPSKALTAATRSRPDFAAVIGDLDHRDPATQPGKGIIFYPPEEADTVLANMRRMRREVFDPNTPIGANFAKAFVRGTTPTRPQVPLYVVWDDHDFCANNAGSDCPFTAQALRVFRENFGMAVNNGLDGLSSCSEGAWQRFAHGTLAEVFILDARSNRETGGASMLGACQRQWLTDGLLASAATWKFVLSPVPLNPGTKPYDAWGAYPAERQQVLDFIQANGIRNVVFISGDIHSGGALDDGSHSGLPEASVPHANMPSGWVDTYCKSKGGVRQCDPGSWTLGAAPTGTMMACEEDTHSCGAGVLNTTTTQPVPLPGTDNPGYLRVDVSATTASLAIMNAAGVQKQGVGADGLAAPMRLDLSAQTAAAPQAQLTSSSTARK